MNKYIITASVLCLFLYVGCGMPQTVRDYSAVPADRLYKFEMPGKEWSREDVSDQTLLLENRENGAWVAIITNFIDNKDLVPKIMVNHLLIDIKDKEILKKDKVTLDGKDAVNMVLNGKVGDSVVKMNVFVVKSGEVGLNIIYWAPIDKYEGGVEEFYSLVKSLKFIK